LRLSNSGGLRTRAFWGRAGFRAFKEVGAGSLITAVFRLAAERSWRRTQKFDRGSGRSLRRPRPRPMRRSCFCVWLEKSLHVGTYGYATGTPVRADIPMDVIARNRIAAMARKTRRSSWPFFAIRGASPMAPHELDGLHQCGRGRLHGLSGSRVVPPEIAGNNCAGDFRIRRREHDLALDKPYSKTGLQTRWGFFKPGNCANRFQQRFPFPCLALWVLMKCRIWFLCGRMDERAVADWGGDFVPFLRKNLKHRRDDFGERITSAVHFGPRTLVATSVGRNRQNPRASQRAHSNKSPFRNA